MLVLDKRDGGREDGPRKERRAREDRIWNAVRGEVGELPEDEGEDDHRQERLDHRPGDPDRGLLVAHRDVPPDEPAQQLAVVPELRDVEVRPAGGRAYNGDARRSPPPAMP